MSGLVMYSGSGCPACVQSAQVMRAQGIPFEEVKVDGNMQLINWMVQQTGQRTIPQFFYNGRHLGSGIHDVLTMRRNGQI